MAKNIEPKLKKIGDYLKLEESTVFIIPEYRRAYSWGIDNCDKLWQDITDFVDSKSKDANKPYWKKDDIIEATGKASDRIVKFIFGA